MGVVVVVPPECDRQRPPRQRVGAAAAAGAAAAPTTARATATARGGARSRTVLLVVALALALVASPAARTDAFLLPPPLPLSSPLLGSLRPPPAPTAHGSSSSSSSSSSSQSSRGLLVRCYVSERQIPQYKETMELYKFQGDAASITPATFDQQQDFDSYLGDEKLVAKPGGTPYKLIHVSKRPLFTPEECQRVIDEVEEVASARGWTTRRHFAYPTTDVPLAELPRTMEWFREQLQAQIYPMLATNFQDCLPDPTKLRVVDAFVVKYDADGGQTELKPHRDGSVVSFNVALNPSHEFEGGGTFFAGLKDALRIEQGHVLSHASNVLHGGHPITGGKRYILVAFVILEQYQSFAMRFANLVWDY